MTEEKARLLQQQLSAMHKAARGLSWSFNRWRSLDVSQQSEEDEEKFETLTARFARMSDILVENVLRFVDNLDLESPGTMRNRINRAEKRINWIGQ